MVGKVHQPVLCRQDQPRCVNFLFRPHNADTPLHPPSETVLSVKKLIKILPPRNQKFLEPQSQTPSLPSLPSSPILSNQINTQILVPLHTLLQILKLSLSGKKEIADPQLLDKSRPHIGPQIQLGFELVVENSELKMVVGVGCHPHQLVQLVQIQQKSVSVHLVDGLIVAHWSVVLGYYARVGSQ